MIGFVLTTSQCGVSPPSDEQPTAVTADEGDGDITGNPDGFRKSEDVITEMLGGPSQHLNPNTASDDSADFDSLFDSWDTDLECGHRRRVLAVCEQRESQVLKRHDFEQVIRRRRASDASLLPSCT